MDNGADSAKPAKPARSAASVPDSPASTTEPTTTEPRTIEIHTIETSTTGSPTHTTRHHTIGTPATRTPTTRTHTIETPTIEAPTTETPTTRTPTTGTPTTENSTMEPPPEGVYYDTPELGIAAVNAFARDHGYALTTRRSKRTKKGVLKTIRLCCDRGREYDTRWQKKRGNTLVRETTTATNGCQFGVSLRLEHETNKWRLQHDEVTVHNHGPSDPSSHSIHRRLELAQKASIIDHKIRTGYTARQILASLRAEDSRSVLIAQDIYNRRKKLNSSGSLRPSEKLNVESSGLHTYTEPLNEASKGP